MSYIQNRRRPPEGCGDAQPYDVQPVAFGAEIGQVNTPTPLRDSHPASPVSRFTPLRRTLRVTMESRAIFFVFRGGKRSTGENPEFFTKSGAIRA